VIWFVILVALVNLGLGYLAAMALADPAPWRWPRAALRRDDTDSPSAEPATPEPLQAAEPESATPADANDPGIAAADELPAEWLAELAAAGVVAESYVEAAAHIVRLKVGAYREQLIAAESRVRAALAAGDGPAMALIIADLATVHHDWLERQQEAATMLRERGGREAEHGETAQALEQLLLDQAARIREVTTALGALPFSSEAESDGKQLLARLADLIDAAHALRDGIQDHLAAMLRVGQRLESLGPAVLRDPVTGLANRIGSEAFLDAWNRSDSARSQPLSIALFDIDRFAGVNQRLGTRIGDRTIAALGNLLNELVRKDRGFDRLARYGGQSFFMLLGDTRPHSALTAVERARQSIEATTFDDQGTEFELTISCGVTEGKPDETPADLLKRAHQTLRFAKKSGRNRCAIDDGEGPTLLDPPQFHVQGRVISLDAD
jgi:diguanylate cyclase (GGDEF)-like protein